MILSWTGATTWKHMRSINEPIMNHMEAHVTTRKHTARQLKKKRENADEYWAPKLLIPPILTKTMSLVTLTKLCWVKNCTSNYRKPHHCKEAWLQQQQQQQHQQQQQQQQHNELTSSNEFTTHTLQAQTSRHATKPRVRRSTERTEATNTETTETTYDQKWSHGPGSKC